MPKSIIDATDEELTQELMERQANRMSDLLRDAYMEGRRRGREVGEGNDTDSIMAADWLSYSKRLEVELRKAG